MKKKIEELIEAMYYVANDKKRNTDFSKGYNAAARNFAGMLKNILANHTEPEPPTAPSQRERIATACMAGLLADSTQQDDFTWFAKAAVTAADALIEELRR